MENHDASNPGALLLEMIEAAQSAVVLVAPFIKLRIVDRLFSCIPNSVSIDIVTRWHPHEILAGVSDLEVWTLVQARKGATLRLYNTLHAKYYRTDKTCAVGSANLTAAALGWRSDANLELLLPLPASHPALLEFEKRVFSESTIATADTYELMQEAVSALKEVVAIPSWLTVPGNASDDVINSMPSTPPRSQRAWWPVLRNPELLFQQYHGNTTLLSRTAEADAIRDISHFLLPAGLSENAFNVAIRSQLLTMPAIAEIDQYVKIPRRFGAVRNKIKERFSSLTPGERLDSSTMWQTLIRWLLHFAPERYEIRTPRYSEIFVRKNL